MSNRVGDILVLDYVDREFIKGTKLEVVEDGEFVKLKIIELPEDPRVDMLVAIFAKYFTTPAIPTVGQAQDAAREILEALDS